MSLHGLSWLPTALLFMALGLPVCGEQSAALTADDTAETDEEMPAGFDRYQSILDRMPFGEPPPGFDATLPPGSAAAAAAAAAAQANGELTPEQRSAEEQKMAASVRVSVLNITPSGRTMVGFTDSSAQPPEHYYLPVGGEKNGWEVKDADPASEKVTLAHEGVEVTVKLGEGASGDGKGKGKGKAAVQRPLLDMARRGVAPGARSMGMRTPGAGAPGAVNAMPTGGPGGAMARLRARRMEREQEEARRRSEAAEEAKAERERREAEREQAAAEREQQRNALLQIQEELRRQREEKAAARAEEHAAQQNEQAQE